MLLGVSMAWSTSLFGGRPGGRSSQNTFLNFDKTSSNFSCMSEGKDSESLIVKDLVLEWLIPTS